MCKRLAADFDLKHFSTGQWLRAQTGPPIAGVPKEINQYVETDTEVAEELLTATYSDPQTIPPALLLYNCTKKNISTPSEMWLRALPDIKAEFVKIAQSPRRPTAILLDNFPKTIIHAHAAAETFGRAFPDLIISVRFT